jgi:hypothetical protein
MGFRRDDGRAGVRNWILIVPTSNCSSHEANTIAMQAEFSGLYSREKYPNVDGVTAIPHNRGCGCPDMMPVGKPVTAIPASSRQPCACWAIISSTPTWRGAADRAGLRENQSLAFNRFIARDFSLLDERPSAGPSVRIVNR